MAQLGGSVTPRVCEREGWRGGGRGCHTHFPRVCKPGGGEVAGVAGGGRGHRRHPHAFASARGVGMARVAAGWITVYTPTHLRAQGVLAWWGCPAREAPAPLLSVGSAPPSLSPVANIVVILSAPSPRRIFVRRVSTACWCLSCGHWAAPALANAVEEGFPLPFLHDVTCVLEGTEDGKHLHKATTVPMGAGEQQRGDAGGDGGGCPHCGGHCRCEGRIRVLIDEAVPKGGHRLEDEGEGRERRGEGGSESVDAPMRLLQRSGPSVRTTLTLESFLHLLICNSSCPSRSTP
ncbi:hypothetical protein BC826DRAFT_1023068 [Russula brevipes]|nr:hypothetical protein BC826DRAFT_1023068 [Russula brevipes]